MKSLSSFCASLMLLAVASPQAVHHVGHAAASAHVHEHEGTTHHHEHGDSDAEEHHGVNAVPARAAISQGILKIPASWVDLQVPVSNQPSAVSEDSFRAAAPGKDPPHPFQRFSKFAHSNKAPPV